MVNSFDRLRHDSVIGCYYEHGNIGHLSTAGAHGSESFVARSIQEGHLLAIDLYLVGSDVLSDAARLRIHDIGLANCIQQPGFAMIYMSHDGHYRRAGSQVSTLF